MSHILVFLAGFAVGVFRREIARFFYSFFWSFLVPFCRRLKEVWQQRFDTLRKKLIATLFVLLYLLLSAFGILLLVAMGAGFIIAVFATFLALFLLLFLVFFRLGAQVIAAFAWLGAMGYTVWLAVEKFFDGWGSMFEEILNWIARLWTGFWKMIGTAFLALPIAFPSCSSGDKPAPVPPKVEAPAPKRFEVGRKLDPNMKVIQAVTVKRGEGCMRITKRGGMPLSFVECRALAEEHDRKVELRRGFTLAPNIFRGETWYLVNEGGIQKWIIPLTNPKR